MNHSSSSNLGAPTVHALEGGGEASSQIYNLCLWLKSHISFLLVFFSTNTDVSGDMKPSLYQKVPRSRS